MSRNVMLAGLIGVVVVAAGIGWFVGSQIRSPAEAAAEAEPPPASNITVEVVSEELSADVVTRGDVVYDEPVQVTLSGSFANQPERLIVTQAVEAGVDLDEGDVVVEVVGRPVMLLTGEIPMYRDLRPGSSGDDVLQLEEALARMGLFEGVPDQTWDEATGAAVAAWYEQAGYRPNGLSEEDEATLRAARDRVRSGEGAVADAIAAVNESSRGVGRAAILAAEGEVDAARDALSLAKLDRTWANEDAAAAVEQAEADVAAAQTALEQGQTANPPLTPEEIAQLEADLTLAETTLSTATRNVDRVAAEQDSLVAQAENRLDVASASLSELRRGTDTSAIRRQVTAAQDELNLAREELAELENELGTWLPAGEVVFLDRLPVRVDQVSVARGSEITGSFVTVTGSIVNMQAAVSEADAGLIEVGMAVQIENPEGDTSIPGTISLVAERPGTNNVAADRVYIEIEPEEIPQELVGQNVRVVIPVSSTGGEVLAVPAAALYSTADGSIRLEVEESDGTLRTVTVETGLAADGLVEITPTDGELAEGDLVVVGRADGSGPGGEDAADTGDEPEDG